MSAHVQPPSNPPKQATSAASAATAAAEPVSSQRKNPLFAIALAIVGTLPLGLGVGVACRARSVETNEAAACSAHDESPVHDQTASAHEAWRNLSRADDLFRAGDFQLALQLYQSKENGDSLRPSAERVLKIALCREGLGQHEEALTALGSMTEHASDEIRSAALIARCRIQLRRREFAKTRATLGELLADQDQSAVVKDETQFLLVIACLLEDEAGHNDHEHDRPISSLDDALWLGPEMLAPVTLEAIREPIPEVSRKALAAGFERIQNPRLAPCGSQIRFSDSLSEPTNSATSSSSSEEHEPVASLLTDAAIEQRREAAEQLAEHLLASQPTHQLAGILQLTLGEVSHRRGDLPQAASRFRTAVGKGISMRSVVAAHNEGVTLFQLREYGAASRALGRFIDSVPKHALRPRALLLRGRALLELGEGALAAFDLKRAADSQGPDETRAWATVFMGLAHLQAHQPKLAAQDLLLRRDHVQSEPSRTAAGFAVSLARLETLPPGESLDRETLFMLRALSKLDPQADWLGAAGRMLIGRAYQRLNLFDQAAEAFQLALHGEVSEPLASEIKLALAECFFATGDPTQAQTWLADVRRKHPGPPAVNAGLRLAQWELAQGHRAECLAICRELWQPDAELAPVLRLMGEAHALAGHDELAAECFAGLHRP